MLTLYVLALGFGGTMLLVSLVAGFDQDVDMGYDFDADAALEFDAALDQDLTSVHHPAAPSLQQPQFAWLWLPLLSIRFWTFACTLLGVVGVTGTWLGFSSVLVASVSIASALVVAWPMAYTFQRLQHDVITGQTSIQHLRGSDATVELSIRPGKRGQVRIDRPTGSITLGATTQDQQLLDIGEKVVVVRVIGRDVEVSSLATGFLATGKPTRSDVNTSSQEV